MSGAATNADVASNLDALSDAAPVGDAKSDIHTIAHFYDGGVAITHPYQPDLAPFVALVFNWLILALMWRLKDEL